MDFILRPLPYPADALEPHIGRETVARHHEKHHAGYLKKLKELIEGRPEEQESLERIVRSADGPVFDNAAQVWNHDFYWRSMDPKGGGAPRVGLAAAIQASFGSFAAFRGAFLTAGGEHFGSGWLWFVAQRRALAVVTTANADLPLRRGAVPLLTADLWEHAYYVDYRNERGAYLEAFFDHLANWDFAAANWSQVGSKSEWRQVGERG
jgi:Fe-Mn family superoxide dismutase